LAILCYSHSGNDPEEYLAKLAPSCIWIFKEKILFIKFGYLPKPTTEIWRFFLNYCLIMAIWKSQKADDFSTFIFNIASQKHEVGSSNRRSLASEQGHHQAGYWYLVTSGLMLGPTKHTQRWWWEWGRCCWPYHCLLPSLFVCPLHFFSDLLVRP
jgi:hypothetical protein